MPTKHAANRSKASPAAEKKKQRSRVFPIVAVGASAGGIEAFTALLKNLPDSPGIAFIFILHQDPKHESNLAQILARSTRLPVDVIREGMTVESDRLYIAPPGAEVSIQNGVLHLHRRPSGTPAVIDAFFSSLAEDQGSRAFSVVLSGSASDGALGTKEIKAEGGITFAQDDSARMDSMPHAAIRAGSVDFVLPPNEIAEELVRIARHVYINEDTHVRLPEQQLLKLFSLIHTRHDIDFTHYKPSTIERRIRRRMALRKVSTLKDYLPIVRDDPKEIEKLYGDILIRVTGFFRDPGVFEALQRAVFPELLERSNGQPVRVWVPGCATGEEVYSLAISLLDTARTMDSATAIQIFGMDVSESAIDQARKGIYPESISAEVPEDRLGPYFTKMEGCYRVNKQVRDCCIFTRQNVVQDAPLSKLDLISCRNVMIYFGTTLQRRVFSIFHYGLRPDGFLLLGTSETVGNFADLFGIVDRKHKIYRKKAVVARPLIEMKMGSTPERVPPQRATNAQEEPLPNTVFREADRLLLNRYTPAGVLINDAFEVLQFRGRTSRYLEPPTGTASFNLLKMAREGLLADLRAAIHAARKKDMPERREGVRVRLNEHSITVNVEVIPFVGGNKEQFLLVLFDEPDAEAKTGKKTRSSKKAKAEEVETRHVSRLRRELDATREYLESIIEEQEAMNEEQRSANEEIQWSNEELQSTNEELETAKEELQSTNEELTTLNEELENRNQELAVVNSDLINLLASVEIPIVMLDGKLRIRRFNPIAQRKLNLVAADVGRRIGDVNTKLQLDHLEQIVREVIDSLKVREIEVKDRSGHTQSLRIRPYRTTDNKIDGAVLVLIDLEEFGKRISDAAS